MAAAEQKDPAIESNPPAQTLTQLMPALKETRGRPTTFNQDIASKICDKIIDEGMTLAEVCRQDGFPSEGLVYRWLRNNQAFAEQYAKARKIRLMQKFDRLEEIASDSRNDWMERKGVQVANHDHINRSRLIIDTLKWQLAKEMPREFGDHQTIDIDARLEVTDISEFEVARRMAFLMNKQERA